MKKKRMSTQLNEAAVEYFTISSIHGTAYFFSKLNILERIFWMFIVIVMMILAFLLINSALVDWNANPTISVTEPINSPIKSIQFPTVTLCPDFMPDRFGFARNVFNLFKFQCSNEDECYDAGDGSYQGFETVWFALTDRVKTSRESDFFQDNDPDFLSHYVRDSDSDFLETLLRQKLAGKISNYDIFSFLKVNVSEAMNDSYLTRKTNCCGDDDENLDEPCEMCTFPNFTSSEKKLIFLTYLVLSWPLAGSYGTLFYNFAFIYNPDSLPTYWLYGYDQSRTLTKRRLQQFNILSGMLNGTDLGISVDEVSAIFHPTPTYLASQKYHRQFRNTAFIQINRTERNYTYPAETINFFNDSNAPPKFILIPNYFGKMLGTHLLQVMEIMFHCQLRVRPISNDRFSRVQDIYGGMDKFREYVGANIQVDLTSEPFNPSWEDYKAYNKTPYTWSYKVASPYIRFLSFANDPAPQYNPRYNGKADSDFDAILKSLRAKYQYQNILTICKGPEKNSTCDDKFHPVLTDSGICYAFNAREFDYSFIGNTYTNMFKRVYEPKNDTKDILKNENSGKAFQLLLLLDSHKSKIVDNIKGTFKVGINQILGFMNVRDNAIEAEVGYVTKITIDATQFISSDSFKHLDMSIRKCRYMAENQVDSLFNFYSYEQCKFECRLRHSSRMCACTPWNYPHYGNTSITEICDGVQSYCFESKMNDEYDTSQCDCLPNCEDILFSVKSDKFKMNYNEECNIPEDILWGMSLRENDLSLIIAEKIRNMDGEEYLFWYNKFQNEQLKENQFRADSNSSSLLLEDNRFARYMSPRLTQDICRSLLETDFALVTVEVATQTVVTIKRDVAVDFATKIANIGGTLGLFTGMSIISFFEIVFFLYKLTATATKPAMMFSAKRQQTDNN